jgi:hypothetical protein
MSNNELNNNQNTSSQRKRLSRPEPEMEQVANKKMKTEKNIYCAQNENFSYIFNDYMIEYIYNIADYTKMKSLCKDLYNRIKPLSKYLIPNNVDKLDAIKSIKNKSLVEIIEMDFKNNSEYLPNSEVLNEFIGLKELFFTNLSDYGIVNKFNTSLSENLVNLNKVTFINLSFGTKYIGSNFSDFVSNRLIKTIKFENCPELTEKNLLRSVFLRKDLILEIVNCPKIRQTFMSGFMEIADQLFINIILKSNNIIYKKEKLNKNTKLGLEKKIKIWTNSINETFDCIKYDDSGNFISLNIL